MTKYMITSRQQNMVQNQNLVIGSLSFENVENFKYLGEMKTSRKLEMTFAKKLNAE